jgi:hypothetical protein
MINIYYDDPSNSLAAQRRNLSLFQSGSGVAYLTSAILFTYAFRRRLALTLVSIQFVTLTVDASYFFLNYMVPSYDRSD